MFSSITQSSSKKSSLPSPVPSKSSNPSIWQKTRTACSPCCKVLLTPYYRWSEWLERNHPRVAPYKYAILISLGLFLLALLIIIIIAAVGGFQNYDIGAPGLNMSGSGDGTYY
ncbi:743_t:CDS:1, partial [Cetraspora pellucida]